MWFLILQSYWSFGFKGPLTDLFKLLLSKIYSHITLSFLVSSELFHVFKLFMISELVTTSSGHAHGHVTHSKKCKGSQAYYFFGIFSP